MGLPRPVRKLARLRDVEIRQEPVYDGSGPGPSSIPNPQKIRVKLAIQLVTSNPISLERAEDGDQTTGQIRVWVADRDLSLAYEASDPDEAPLDLTALPIAPPEKTDGPPGALIKYRNRTYELDRDLGWDEALNATGKAGFKRYRGSEWSP